MAFSRQYGIPLMITTLGAACLLAPATPAAAQGGARMRVLVPAFTRADGSSDRQGDRLADRLRRELNAMPRHVPVDMKEAEAAMKRLGLRKADMNCIRWQQLAGRMGDVGLVLCGTIDDATDHAEASFEPVGGGADPFRVESFAMTSPEQAAQHIVQAFGTYVQGLQLARSCNDYITIESWSQAVDACEAALAINPRSTGAMYSRGTALRGLGRIQEAFDAYRAVLDLDPLHTDAMMAAGYVAAQLRRPDIAMQYFRQYLELEPDADRVRLTIASQLANEGDPEAALTLVEPATSRPDASRATIVYAGHFAVAAALMRREAGPATDEAAADDGTALLRQALLHYERALALAPDSADALTLRQMMVAYRGVGQLESALAVGERAVGAADADAQTWAIYAEVLRDAERLDESLTAIERAQDLDPAFPVHGRRALLLLDASRLDDAVASARAGVDTGEISGATLESIAQRITQLGLAHANAQRFQEAIRHYDAARELGKSERSLGMANFFQGFALYQQADRMLRNATTAAPAREARPLLEKARVLLEGADGYVDQRAKRDEVLQSIREYMAVADALIRSGR